MMTTAASLETLRDITRSDLLKVDRALKKQNSFDNSEDAFFWDKHIQKSISTAHPYLPNTRFEFVVEEPKARRMSVYFHRFQSERNNDVVVFYDRQGKKIREMSGSLDNTWSEPFEENYLKIVFSSNGFRQNYGFDLTEVAYQE